MSYIAPTPRPERIASVVVDGAEFVVGWDEEKHDEPTWQHGRWVTGSDCWVDSVRIDGVWFYAIEVFTQQWLDRMNAALVAPEDNREAA